MCRHGAVCSTMQHTRFELNTQACLVRAARDHLLKQPFVGQMFASVIWDYLTRDLINLKTKNQLLLYLTLILDINNDPRLGYR